jgi:adenosine deaminase
VSAASTIPPHALRELLEALPKTDIHVHLDGSLRPETILDIMRAENLAPPADTPEGVRDALSVAGESLSLPEYLEFFRTTCSVLQRAEYLERAAYELAMDAAAERVRYIEVRFSPILHLEEGLDVGAVLDAVLAGLTRAERDADIRTGVIVCGIRHIEPEKSLELARLAVDNRDRGVVAFDLAGAERDNPAKHHLEAFYHVLNANMNVTVHAGEAFGAPSIHQAIHYCGAHRIGHGTRLRDDPELLRYVNDHRIPIEMCLTSNLHTGAVNRLEDHPFRAYFDAGLRVSLNTDNRLISRTTITDELEAATTLFDLTPHDLRRLTIHGLKSAFLPYREKQQLVASIVAEVHDVFDRLLPDIDMSRDPVI